MQESEGSRRGQTFSTADGGIIKNQGEKTAVLHPEHSQQAFRAKYQITDVTKPLNSVGKVCDQRNQVLFTSTGGYVIDEETGESTWFPREGNIYVMHSWVKEDESTFTRQES